jgi:L-asparaginase
MKLLLISCGGTIVSPVSDGGVQAAERATTEAVARLTEAILPPEMLLELNRRSDEDYAEAPNVARSRIELVMEQTGPGALTTVKKPARAKVPPLTRVITLFDVDSTEVGPAHWGKVVNCILDNYDDFDGFIVTHGTNTLAYTASALTFGLPRIGKPVVMTGANLPLGLPFSDATVNASNALLLVHKMIAEGRGGVVVVFASRVMPGPRTKKANGTELEAFTTFNAPNIGQMRPKKTVIIDGEFNRYVADRNPESPWYQRGFVKDAAELRKESHADFGAIISSHTFHPGDDPASYLAVMDMLEAKRRDTGLRGALIVRAVGDGDVSHLIQNQVFVRAKQLQIPIVVTTQEPGGTSSFTGNKQSEGAEDKFAVIPAWDMSIETMVVKLRYLLARELPYADIHGEFVKSYHGEIKRR